MPCTYNRYLSCPPNCTGSNCLQVQTLTDKDWDDLDTATQDPRRAVPCDDAAIERAARALAARDGWSRFPADDDRDWYIAAATQALRAASNTDCTHQFQHHPLGEDSGVCSKCGAEEVLPDV